MRNATLIVIGITSLLTTHSVSGQSAFLDNGQDGTAFGLFYTSQDRNKGYQIDGYGVTASFSADGQADINTSIASVGRKGISRHTVICLGGTPYLRSDFEGGLSVLLGLPLALAFTTESRSSHTAMIGIASEVALPTGHRARLVLSAGLSYQLLLEETSEHHTMWGVSVGQSVWFGKSSAVIGISLSQPISENHDSQVGFHLDFLFPQ